MDIQSLAFDGVDVLIVNPVEQSASTMGALQAKINEVMDMGIPVVVVGNRPPNLAYTSYVGQDPYEVGCIMAQELTALIYGEGPIGVINAVDLSVADVSFKEGERAIFADYPSIIFVAEAPTNYVRSEAFNLMTSVQVDGMMGYAGDITLGAQQGLASQGVSYVPFVSTHNAAEPEKPMWPAPSIARSPWQRSPHPRRPRPDRDGAPTTRGPGRGQGRTQGRGTVDARRRS
jgi:ABC-type sugar transport system substrate-binding protein